MKYHLYFLIFSYFSILPSQYRCMGNTFNEFLNDENVAPLDIFSSYITQVKFINNDDIIYLKNNKLTTFNIKNRRSQKITNNEYDFLTKNNKNNQILAIQGSGNMLIYNKNIITLIADFKYSLFNSYQFSPQDNTIIFHSSDNNCIQEYNYQNNTYSDQLPVSKDTILLTNPIKGTICLLDNASVKIYKSSLQQPPRVIPLEQEQHAPHDLAAISVHHLTAISVHDLLAITHKNSPILSIINCNSKNNSNAIQILRKPTIEQKKCTYSPQFVQICFNATGSVLLTISDLEESYAFEYWDTKTLKVLSMQTLEIFDKSMSNEIFDIDFSPDNTKLSIAFSNKCIIYEIPFKRQYTNDTACIITYINFVLKQLYTAENEKIPSDIIQLIMQKMLLCLKL